MSGKSRERAEVVVVGASAGGLEALEAFFAEMPDQTGLAFIIVQHLSPDFKSIMDDLLARRTRIPIHQAGQGMPLEPDHIYLTPPQSVVSVQDNVFGIERIPPHSGVALPIDESLANVAKSHGDRAAAVILSGTGSDGAQGVQAIAEAGGTVLVQSPETAKFDGMPRSAARTGVAALVGSPRQLAQSISGRQVDEVPPEDSAGPGPDAPGSGPTGRIFAALRAACGIDFSIYKQGTILRRLERRLQAVGVDDLDAYAERLVADPDEVSVLVRDLLIEVTEFFRDKPAWELIEEKLLAPVFEGRRPGQEVRVWVAGCATGEEAYSWAILLKEYADRLGHPPGIKVFATDVHRGSLDRASAASYDRRALANVGEDRLAAHFDELPEGRFRIKSGVRGLVVFAEHNILKDPPFTRVDFISCRNLLIYLEPDAQERILTSFHFALSPGGILLLGPSETAGKLAPSFEEVDRHWRLMRKNASVRPPALPAVGQLRARGMGILPGQQHGTPGLAHQREAMYGALLDRFIPAGFLVSADGLLLHVFGRGGRYLVMRGPASTRLDDCLEKELRVAIATAMQRALRSGEPVSYTGIRSCRDGEETMLAAHLEPVEYPGAPRPCVLVRLTEENATGPGESPVPEPEAADFRAQGNGYERVLQLEEALRETRENLQATVEELETSNEELQATNEELLASNEELQSTNEELQSVNEELYTVNSEYENRNEQLDELNRDLVHLMECTEIGTLFLDSELCIRRFTPSTRRAFRLLKQDIGRPLSDIASLLDDKAGLLERARGVLSSGDPSECEVAGPGDKAYIERINPLTARGGVIDGVVITFVDITQRQQVQRDLSEATGLLKAMLDSMGANVAVVDGSGTIVAVNRSWEEFARANDAGALGSVGPGSNYFAVCVAAAGGGESSFAQKALAGLRDVMLGRKPVFEMPYPCHAPDERRWFLMRVTPLGHPRGGAVVVHLNVTGLYENQASLETLSMAVEGSAHGVAVTDKAGRIQSANRAFRDMVQAAGGDCIGQPVGGLAQGAGARELEEAMLHEGATRCTVVSPRPGADPAYLEVFVSPVKSRTAAVTGYLLLVTDVSGRRRAAEFAEQAERLEAVGRLAGGVAHDLNNMLTPILGYAEILADDEQARDLGAGEILAGATRAKTLTAQLLSFSRRQALRLEPISVKELAEGLRRRVQPMAGEHLHLEFKDIPGDITVRIDRDQVTTAMASIVEYAVSACGESGTVTVGARRVLLGQEDQSEYPSLVPGRYALLSIQHDGAGIPHDQLQHVFEPYYAPGGKGKGAGLALSTAYGTARQHGGTVLVKSEPGVGSVFTLCLPMVMHEEDGTSTGAARAATPRATGQSIILVEDEQPVRDFTERLLVRNGFHVQSYALPRLALRDFESGEFPVVPDLLVTDVIMPEISGNQVAEVFSARWPRVPVLFMSGYSEEFLKHGEALRPGVELLAKPFSSQDLLRRVHELLELSKPQDDQEPVE